MADEVTIANMALSLIGADAVVSAIDPPDGSTEAAACARFFATARTAMLEQGSWSFSKKRRALSVLSTNPSSVWAYAYQKPSDCLSARRVLPGATEQAGLIFSDDARLALDDRDGDPFELEGSTLLTNTEDAVLVYITDVTDSTKFSATFTTAFATMLAAFIAGPIVRGAEGRKLAMSLREEATALAAISDAADANQSQFTSVYIPPSIAARA